MDIKYEDGKWQAQFYKIFVDEKTGDYDHYTLVKVEPYSGWISVLEKLNRFQLTEITCGGQGGADGGWSEIEIADNRIYKHISYSDPSIAEKDWRAGALVAVFSILESEFGVAFYP